MEEREEDGYGNEEGVEMMEVWGFNLSRYIGMPFFIIEGCSSNKKKYF